MGYTEATGKEIMEFASVDYLGKICDKLFLEIKFDLNIDANQ